MAGWLSWQRWHFIFLIAFLFFLYQPYAIFVRNWSSQYMHVGATQAQWSLVCVLMCGLQLVPMPGTNPVSKERRTMLIGNHRNFTDFFLHDVVTEFTGNILSRALVGVVFFFFAISTFWEHTLWFFVRGRAREDPELFYQWLDHNFACSRNIRNNLLVYPEGHRNLKPDPLPLRTGMLRYAYSRKLLLQIFICHGYDEMLNQKTMTATFKRLDVHYFVDKPIDTQDFPTFEAFLEVVQKRFNHLFYEVKAHSTGNS